MSQRHFSYQNPATDHLIKVTAGWDRPLQEYFLRIHDQTTFQDLFNSLSLDDPSMDLDGIDKALKDHFIPDPTGFLFRLEQDAATNMGNDVMIFDYAPHQITLKNLKISKQFSEETTAFTADVWVDGFKVASAKNNGTGGMTMVMPYPNMRDVFKDIERTLFDLPPVSFGISDATGTIPPSLTWAVDRIVDRNSAMKEANKWTKKNQNITARLRQAADWHQYHKPYNAINLALMMHQPPFVDHKTDNIIFLNSLTEAVGAFRLEWLSAEIW